jgi:hypothetical protein
MTSGAHKVVLTAHVISSVGWFGAVAGFLALAIAGLTSQDAQIVRGAYLAMELMGWFVIVPLSLVSLLTGVMLSLGTTWGFFRHYWVVAKIVMTIPAIGLLLLHMGPISSMARLASASTFTAGDLSGLRIQLVAYAGAALVVLIVATVLSMHKPRGWTRYGWRKQQEQRMASQP